MLDIACTREGFARGDISNIGFIRTRDNLADGLTKPMNQSALQSVLMSGKLRLQPEQWIIRDAPGLSTANRR